MFSNFLVKRFVKDSENVSDIKVRGAYANLAGVVGIITNLILFIIKLSVGLLSNSVSILADAFNNLSDAASSIITIVGFKMANKPADAEHPFGHGRIEYITAMIVSFMVMLVGLQFVKTSFQKIINPTPVTFELLPFILLLVSIVFKFWLSKFNKSIGNKINSSTLKATATDAMGDVFTSTTVVISFLISKFTTLPIDGYIGIIVALAIVYSGFSLIKETLNPLLGEPPDPVLVSNITDMVMSYENITGIHDLIVHNYGPGRIMASIHAEIPSNIDIMEIHHIIDTAEREISKKLNIYLVIHMDPICVDTDEIIEARNMVQDVLSKYEEIKSFHDFRIVGDHDKKNLIFDIEVSPTCLSNESNSAKLLSNIKNDIKEKSPEYKCVITVDLAL
ncbi:MULTISPECIES: cation diffusion facilitator family transporter [unclassified Clostridium]|jgi:cation diffusion facilitator family transporter|uniref:cation diffusion facilitator family transporter n=1 Tax=Clostridium TaxID=1485 RepID=UPI001C8CDCD1|nr:MULTISPECIES: cation diffusion facilitator family transporter [unclassified Clostridium]MBX9136319.1 cation transporter [Clostridium sp. K12(2020)]MBX9143409.1 cation transporter [Clostridium sp. K13]MDU2290993.1 cation diffusion facilitator family transporter [Clostridium celatum]MDU4323825.1 cation diffusion facilitator family transporter [Clostridium celatum]